METALITAFATVIAVTVSSVVGYLTANRARATQQKTDEAKHQVEASADNREWAKLWMDRAEKAERRVDDAEQRVDDMEVHVDEVTSTLVRHIRVLEAEVTRLGGTVPQMPDLPQLHRTP